MPDPNAAKKPFATYLAVPPTANVLAMNLANPIVLSEL
jgi:hypothetical protein